MLMIRYQRFGRRNDPAYRIVVTEKTNGPKSGNFVEVVGNYNPKTKQKNIHMERISYWMNTGAKLSDTVHNLLVSEKHLDSKKINVLPKKTPIVKETKHNEQGEENVGQKEKNIKDVLEGKMEEQTEETVKETQNEDK